jgi:hypothetical protein
VNIHPDTGKNPFFKNLLKKNNSRIFELSAFQGSIWAKLNGKINRDKMAVGSHYARGFYRILANRMISKRIFHKPRIGGF